jgi:branched-chain amino acid transport system ATP-binding protein
MADLLHVEQLRAGYGEAVVLQGISFSLAAGETLALLGRNGTGKTTLINTLVGATRWHSGRIMLSGQSIAQWPSYQRVSGLPQGGMGWVPQERAIFSSLSVLENLTAVARSGPWTPRRVFEMFPRLAERQSNMGNQLSGGEQQMLAIGRALVINPQLLLLDEPLEGLAPIIVEELLSAIARITREEGLTAIIVEQHPQAILAISHQAVVLDQGRVVHQGSAQTLASQPALLDQLLGVARA